MTRTPVGVLALLGAVVPCHQSSASTGSASSYGLIADNSAVDSGTRGSTSSQNKSSSIADGPFSPGSHNISVDVGQVFLIGDISQFSDTLGGQLHYTYGVSDLFGFDSTVSYSSHSEGKYSVASAVTGMKINLTWYDKVLPYAAFGLGFYLPSYQDPTANPVSTNTTAPQISALLFGGHLGAGIDMELTKNLFFGAAITFHNMFGATKLLANGTPLNLGGSWASFFLHLGVTF